MMSCIGNVQVCLGCTKTRSPRIGTVLHWQPPDVHIFDTDPSLILINNGDRLNVLLLLQGQTRCLYQKIPFVSLIIGLCGLECQMRQICMSDVIDPRGWKRILHILKLGP